MKILLLLVSLLLTANCSKQESPIQSEQPQAATWSDLGIPLQGVDTAAGQKILARLNEAFANNDTSIYDSMLAAWSLQKPDDEFIAEKDSSLKEIYAIYRTTINAFWKDSVMHFDSCQSCSSLLYWARGLNRKYIVLSPNVSFGIVDSLPSLSNGYAPAQIDDHWIYPKTEATNSLFWKPTLEWAFREFTKDTSNIYRGYDPEAIKRCGFVLSRLGTSYTVYAHVYIDYFTDAPMFEQILLRKDNLEATANINLGGSGIALKYRKLQGIWIIVEFARTWIA